MFNNHRLSTENGWSPNQIWLNGNNPLRFSDRLDDSVVDQHYGEDPNGPRPLPEVEGVVVEPVQIVNEQEISDPIIQQINVNRPSDKAGVDVYTDVNFSSSCAKTRRIPLGTLCHTNAPLSFVNILFA